ncbi:MAG: hypothetical protein K2Z81_02335 [Cyanobacteria bacterium]|nr:hypothetical protein [Cyanobacteriota bacterium]
MPLFFVHGVSTRSAHPDYEKDTKARNEFFSQLTMPAYLHGKTSALINNPYWGDKGANPLWGNGSLPRPDDAVEQLGPENFDLLHLIGPRPEGATASNSVLQIARQRSLVEATDILFAESSKHLNLDAEKRGNTARVIVSYALANPNPSWVTDAKLKNNDDFINELRRQAEQFDKETYETFGASDFWEELKESAQRLGDFVPRITSKTAVDLARNGLQEKLSLFLGDAFVYWHNRWVPKAGEIGKVEKDGNIPGPIARIVMDALIDAYSTAKTSPIDNKLIVVAHSMGGNIVYDLCTDFFVRYDKPFEIDVFITVGSQVAMFQEIDMFRGVSIPNRVDPKITRIDKPKNIKSWLNIYDKNDVVSFCTERVLNGVTDHPYDTGFDTIRAHTGYFSRASFYKRLGLRIAEALDADLVPTS